MALMGKRWSIWQNRRARYAALVLAVTFGIISLSGVIPGRYGIALSATTLAGVSETVPPLSAEENFQLGAEENLQLGAEENLQLGMDYYRNNQLDAAIAPWQSALEQYRRHQNQTGERRVLELLTFIHLELGQYRQVITLAQSTLDVAMGPDHRELRVRIQANLGIAYNALGNYLAAIAAYQQALEDIYNSDDPSARNSEAQVLGLLANAHEGLGNYERTAELHQQSLTLAQQLANPNLEAVAHVNLGATYARLGDYDRAIRQYKTSLDSFQTLGDIQGTVYALNNLGVAYYVQDKLSLAIDQLQQALTIAETSQQPDMIGAALGSLGSLYADQGDYDQALDYHEQSLAIARSTADPKTTTVALNNLGHTLFEAGQLADAAAKLYEAVDVLESLRPGLDDNSQISLFDTQVLTYNLLQQILVAQGNIETALEVAERGRARAFVELVAQQTDNLPEAAKVPNIEQIRTIAKEQKTTLVEYTLVPDDSFKFQGKQRGTSERLYVWVVQPTGNVDFREVDLKPLQQDKNLSIAKLVETSRDRSGIRGASSENAPEDGPGNSRGLIRPGDQVRRAGDPLDWAPYDVTAIDPRAGTVTLSHPDFTLPNPVVALSEVYKINDSAFATVLRPTSQWQDLYQLLIAPIADLLPTSPEDRVVFIPQEQLFLVPFPALQAEDGSYLIEHHTILSAPAIQILGLTNRNNNRLSASQPAGQPERQPAGPPLVVGNPSPMPENLQALPHAGTEAVGIANVLSTRALTGDSATETAIKQQLANASLIHLATHGFFNESNPLQGSLAFAPTDDQDGFLTAAEILTQSLRADLVVLSACDTGRGQITGDGVIGLSRSFLAAGAENVMVSLWQVPDDATAQLMIEFYRQRQHLDNAQALRQAMLATRQQYKDPLAWAAFTLIGAIDS
ncbi:CHAT domain-containing protein [Leptothoe spongobia]|uniref:CHAT domain-containing protein n=1 Tax=Leptothoe spongobia TAU-MAC 1115 TaxID=1967444 RepID=A0A947DGZ9_9CYAN|nr:CHAT domain-containing tetratricopeptide repeat protein [Leptothoe spongobia]MBT9316590.1 CHAT domain-containing protein [Leptothoe spongobia TAU-MAC 1115]